MIRPFEYEREDEGESPCCICGKATNGYRLIEINHTTGDWPKEGDNEDDLSGYPIGPECLRRVRKQGETK